MFGRKFELNAETLHIVEEIGRHMPGGFFIYRDAGDGPLLYANRAVWEIFGCADEAEFRALTGFTFRGMLLPEDYDAIQKSIELQISADEDKMDTVEYRILRKDGTVRWVDDYGHFTETEAYGGIYYVFISDITEKRERMETDMAVRQAVIEALSETYHTVWLINDVETGAFSLYRGDTAGGTIHAGPIRDALGKLRYPQAKEFYIRTTVAPADQARLQEELALENIARRLKEESRFSVNYLRSMDDGSEHYFRIEFAKVNMPGGKLGVVCGFTDVDAETRRTLRQNEALTDALAAARQANRAKTAFLSNMSHEIRTPMNAIIGLNSIALNDPDTPERTRDYLTKIDVSARHLLNIINDILDMSRIESGRMAVKEEEFSISKALEQVNAIVGGQCREKGLRYTCSILGELNDSYIGDEMKLRQVLINILGNGVKFTPAGGSLSFTIEELARLEGNATLRFTIRDTGIGMSKAFLPHIFEAFSQEDASTTSRYGSTGLGLPITKSIVELMNGQIEVESEQGVGSVFTVTLPLRVPGRRAEDKAGAAEEAGADGLAPKPPCDDGGPEAFRDGLNKNNSALPRGTDLRGRRVLLAEDVAVNAEIMVMLLTTRELEVDVAENGRAALELFEGHPAGWYDAILMDMRMPEMDGLEATRRIRALDRPDAGRVPIIALTANAFDEDVQRSMQAGLNAHLSKPVAAETLFGTLERMIGA